MALDCESKLLKAILVKLVIDSSDKLQKKSYEYLRLLKIKKGAGLVNLSDTCAVVICINLATEVLDLMFDKTEAVKVAGTTKKHYANFYHTVKTILGLDKPPTVSELCVKLSCSDVSPLAQQLIDRYSKKQNTAIDLSHPMYACAAVLAACRHRKVRVQKGLLVESCRIKAKDLYNLASELTSLLDQADKQPSRKRGHHLIDMVEQMVKESQNTSINNQEEEEESDNKPKESFAEWKKRMLAKT